MIYGYEGFDYTDGIAISSDRIKERIKTVVDRLKSDQSLPYTSISSGNNIVIGVRINVKDGVAQYKTEIKVIVSNCYVELIIP